MSRKRKGSGNRKRDATMQSQSFVSWLISDDARETLRIPGYTSMDKNPEIITAVHKIAQLIGTMTIHLMSNTKNGDIRIINELSRLIDIDPMRNMTRSTWMTSIIMNLLLYGKGNAVVLPHTSGGYLECLEPIASDRVTLRPVSRSEYLIEIDGRAFDPQDVLHFVYNPDKRYLWQGQGITVSLMDVANNLKQARATEKGFMESKWKPSIIVKVDALADGFSSPEGREKLLEDYVESSEVGKPWLIPADQFSVEQVKPLTLSDLAINDTMQLDKRTVASVIGVPPFVLGVGEYKKDEWNSFVQNTIGPIAKSLEQEMTKKLILSPKWYLKFNTLSLMDWDIKTVSDVFGGLSDKAIVTGNEVRDRLGMSPMEGLDELRILENYIPAAMIGQQAKLIGGKNDE